jgi:hypothetical protein
VLVFCCCRCPSGGDNGSSGGDGSSGGGDGCGGGSGCGACTVVIEQRPDVDPHAAFAQERRYPLDVPRVTEKGPWASSTRQGQGEYVLENVARRVDEEACDDAVPSAVLLGPIYVQPVT